MFFRNLIWKGAFLRDFFCFGCHVGHNSMRTAYGRVTHTPTRLGVRCRAGRLGFQPRNWHGLTNTLLLFLAGGKIHTALLQCSTEGKLAFSWRKLRLCILLISVTCDAYSFLVVGRNENIFIQFLHLMYFSQNTFNFLALNSFFTRFDKGVTCACVWYKIRDYPESLCYTAHKKPLNKSILEHILTDVLAQQ